MAIWLYLTMKTILLLVCFTKIVFSQLELDLRSKRSNIIDRELKLSVGGEIVLDKDETELNNILMQWKHQEIDYAFRNPQYFNLSHSYFDYKDAMKRSRVYQIIQAMPKGAILHLHGNSILGPDYFLKITYKEHLFICSESPIKFKFSNTTPNEACESKWELLSYIRKSSQNATKFDMELRKNFTLVGYRELDSDSINVWKRFTSIFRTVLGLLTYRPVWEEYLYDALKIIKSDNVIYTELRTAFFELYELTGTKHDDLFFVNTTNNVIERFVNDNPDFVGAKLIGTSGRSSASEKIVEMLNLTNKAKKIFPDLIAGFDLVGMEDKGKPLLEYFTELDAAKHDVDYYFHAGETNWYGSSTDENLIDAIILGTKRIGHAYALLKHPLVLEEVKNSNICIEVSLVSNNVLGLVRDVRNHPLASFIALGLPVVISSDDPGFWESDPLSTDFYVAFVGAASRSHDLRLLKQLALNSIQYSSLNVNKKRMAFRIFEAKWKTFVGKKLRENSGHNNYFVGVTQF